MINMLNQLSVECMTRFLQTDRPHLITKEAIKVVTRLCDTRPLPVLNSMKNEVVMKLTRDTFDRRDLATNPITNPAMKYVAIMIGHKIYFTNREKNLSATTINIGYDMVANGPNYDLCEILQKQLFENLKMTREKKYTFKFGSLIVCLLFYFLTRLPRRDVVVIWDISKYVAHQISHYMHSLGDLKSRNNDLSTFFVVFKSNMNKRETIPKKSVAKYKNDIIFHVSSDKCMIEAVEPQNIWIQHLGYEVIGDEAEGYVQVLLKSLKDTSEPRVGSYAEKYMEFHLEHKKPKIRKKVDEMLRNYGFTYEQIA